MGLTPRQAEILAYITQYADERGYAPTLQEIGARFGLSSVATVHKHVAHLVDKGYLKRERRNASRDIAVVDDEPGGLATVPLLGTVAAGLPIEAVSEQEEIALPESWLGRGRTYALRVKGNSMIEEQIRDGDTVIVESRETARNGETVIALVDGESVTLKQFHKESGGRVRLQPANPEVPVLILPAERVRIQGVVVGVLRRYA
ncbi:MAG TPA: transcriptional repressor LexA [Candidatus Krumholzibacteria bacterium]|nr:transcriptional repressor LexA [Candidatus Krumholzibacteria bacterium]